MAKRDFLLAGMNEVIQKQKTSISMTLIIGGTVVTGTLVASDVAGILGVFPEISEAFEDVIRKHSSDYTDSYLENDEQEYLYMQPVRILSGGHTHPLNFPGPLRIKLSSVDAFMLGETVVDQE